MQVIEYIRGILTLPIAVLCMQIYLDKFVFIKIDSMQEKRSNTEKL